MSKLTKSTKGNRNKTQGDWPLVVYISIFGAGFLGYFVAEIGFNTRPHPLDWASGLAGAVIGCVAGWLWYRWRGDIV
jgi:hypothetical protein